MSQNKIDLPVPIKTPRLILRPLCEDDVQQLTEAYLESMHQLKPWLSWAHTIEASSYRSVYEAERDFIKMSHAKWDSREELAFAIINSSNNQFLGAICLCRINWAIPSMEIRYWLRTSMTGYGYMTEAVHALCYYAFNQLKARRIDLLCDESNKRSRAIPERLGFVQEGILKNYDRAVNSNELCNYVIYARYDNEGLPALAATWPTCSTSTQSPHAIGLYVPSRSHT